MGISEARDLEAVHDGLTRWVQWWRPDARDIRLAPLAQPATGLSSETIFVEVDWTLDGQSPEHASWVVRLPPSGEGLFPSYDLTMQGRLQATLAGAGLPTVAPLAVEEADSWVGAPFLVMPRVAGRVVQAEKPYLRRGWLAEATPEGQATLHGEVVDILARVHRLDWASLGCGEILAARTGRPGAGTTPEPGAWPVRSSTGPGTWRGRARGAHHRSSPTAWSGVATGSRIPNRPPRCYGATSSSGTCSWLTT